jgi:probable addiction module antidote protein
VAETAHESYEYLIHCLGIAAKAKGMTEVAKQAGVTRASLYQSLDGSKKPKFETIAKVMDALNMKLTVERKNGVA